MKKIEKIGSVFTDSGSFVMIDPSALGFELGLDDPTEIENTLRKLGGLIIHTGDGTAKVTQHLFGNAYGDDIEIQVNNYGGKKKDVTREEI